MEVKIEKLVYGGDRLGTLLGPSVTAIARSGKFERRKMARPRRQGSATSKPVAHAFAPWMNARFFRPGSAKHWPNCVRWSPAKLFPRLMKSKHLQMPRTRRFF